jgi:hypothetical protein
MHSNIQFLHLFACVDTSLVLALVSLQLALIVVIFDGMKFDGIK